MKVIVQKVLVELKHSKFGIVEYKDTDANGKVKVNFLFGLFHFVIQ